ncbi:hypothetical protein [Planctomicrobium sp. SH664]|uniref:hypothetical protein n=1 Tax=Planctomicrobium sp. SH664 TaxID=3448125 RepID=UPI003F5C7C50
MKAKLPLGPFCLLAIGMLLGVQPAARAEEPVQLITLLPDDANALSIVRMSEILQTERARREDWARLADEQFMDGPDGIPSWVSTLVVGYLIRSSGPKEVWSSALAVVPEAESIDAIARRNQTAVELLDTLPATRGRGETYLLQVNPTLLGIRWPSVRQEAAQWASALRHKRTGISSEYLQKAAALSQHLVMSIDLDHALDPAIVKMHLEADRRLANQPEKIASLVSLIEGLRGVTLTVQIGDSNDSHVHIDFAQPIGDLAEPVKNFFVEVLHQTGAAIDEFENATVTAAGNSALLSAPLSDESLRRILSLITSTPSSTPEPPAPLAAATAASPTLPAPGGKAPSATRSPRPTSTVSPSRKYLTSVNRVIDDLTKALRRAKNYEQTAFWHENFARKIDELPSQDVDPQLLEYGSHVATRLRALARSLRGQALIINTHEGTITYDMSYDPGWASLNVWGGFGYRQPSYNVTSNVQQVREKQAAAITAGAQQRDEIWQMINEERAAIDRAMREKYGSNF